MNTILTDDELPPLRPKDHPEPHSYAWTSQELIFIRARDRQVEAAVLAKLAAQKASAWMREGWGPDCGPYVEIYRDDEMGWRDRKEWTPLYAAPQPAVVQVPHQHQGDTALAVGNLIFALEQWKATTPTTAPPAWAKLLAACSEMVAAAAPEAPATESQIKAKAIAFDWLLSNCITEDKGGWLQLVYETSRQHEDHHPECAKWVAQDIAHAAGVDLEAAPLPAVVQVPQGIDVEGRRIAAEAENHACSIAVWMTRMDAESPDADALGVSGWLQEAETRIKRRMLAAAPEAPRASTLSRWIERWYGSGPDRGWSIWEMTTSTHGDRVAYVGEGEHSERLTALIVQKHNDSLAAAPEATAQEKSNG